MKLLFGLSLLTTIAVQLSGANNTCDAVVPPKNKLFPIFDLIATKLHDYHKRELLILGAIYTEFIPKYDEYMDRFNTEPHHAYKTVMENFIKSVEEFTNDTGNCNPQYKADEALAAIAAEAKNVNDYEVRRLINAAYNKPAYKQEYKRLLIDLKQQFPTIIKNFVQNLDAADKQKYSDIYKLGQDFVAATNGGQQYIAFKNFVEKINFTENTESASDENCKWNVRNFKTFIENTSKHIFVDLNTLDL